MKRPMRWYWAAAISYVAAHVALSLWGLLTLRGSLVDEYEAPLEPLLHEYVWLTKTIMSGTPPPPGDGILPRTIIQGYLFGAWFRVPFFVAAIATYAYLRRRKPSEYLRCPKCDYILKGLSEPRCPECGERI